jgi:hypothetical protein
MQVVCLSSVSSRAHAPLAMAPGSLIARSASATSPPTNGRALTTLEEASEVDASTAASSPLLPAARGPTAEARAFGSTESRRCGVDCLCGGFRLVVSCRHLGGSRSVQPWGLPSLQTERRRRRRRHRGWTPD